MSLRHLIHFNSSRPPPAAIPSRPVAVVVCSLTGAAVSTLTSAAVPPCTVGPSVVIVCAATDGIRRQHDHGDVLSNQQTITDPIYPLNTETDTLPSPSVPPGTESTETEQHCGQPDPLEIRRRRQCTVIRRGCIGFVGSRSRGGGGLGSRRRHRWRQNVLRVRYLVVRLEGLLPHRLLLLRLLGDLLLALLKKIIELLRHLGILRETQGRLQIALRIIVVALLKLGLADDTKRLELQRRQLLLAHAFLDEFFPDLAVRQLRFNGLNQQQRLYTPTVTPVRSRTISGFNTHVHFFRG